MCSEGAPGALGSVPAVSFRAGSHPARTTRAPAPPSSASGVWPDTFFGTHHWKANVAVGWPGRDRGEPQCGTKRGRLKSETLAEVLKGKRAAAISGLDPFASLAEEGAALLISAPRVPQIAVYRVGQHRTHQGALAVELTADSLRRAVLR